MEWKPKRGSGVPLYKQIAAYLEECIIKGEFPPGSFLPSERELAKKWQVNRSTVVSAFEELRASGIIERIQGSGTQVSSVHGRFPQQRVPNWGHLVEAGSFLPNYPLIRKIRKETLDHELIDMASGELSPDLFPANAFQTIMAQQPFDYHLGYGHPQGNLELRQTLVHHMKKWRGIDSTASSILITSGAQQALHLIVQCLLKPGDAVAVEDPSYFYSLPLFHSAGVRVFSLPVGGDGIDPDDVLELHRKHRIKLIFVNPNYQNPTGTVLSLARKKRLLELSVRLGIPIVEDDPYSLTAFDGEPPPTLKSLDPMANVLYVSSLTKIVASGLRIGWIIGPQAVMERLADAKQIIDFGHSVFPQWLASKFLGSDSFVQHLQALRHSLGRKKDLITFALHDLLPTEVEFVEPAGGIHIWCRLNREVNEQKLLKQSIKQGVAYVPGLVLGSNKNCIRFTFGRAEQEQIYEGIKRFSEVLKSLLHDKSGESSVNVP
ncbi:PLP-dependent aminotransferase family protein [Brevibacillus fulvus]|uniref:DNA-binding transcriptional MocR family regulator n=1 Tax=Brevibacillus fulvus TaxID=1125967 RepID=A0A938XVF1_9BACL|nr:PLP-dependent aminotransferase family protein [Brevibacillus fulvus]MBM7588819.1 DNA-binding transcriptional MocR family regulator [Brevibacillus fulvus]